MLVLSFGVWVSQRRHALRLTQHEVAGLVGCSLILVRKIEADERRPSRQIAELLARALHIPPNDIPAFVRAARAELVVDQLPAPVDQATDTFVHSTLPSLPAAAGNLPSLVYSFVGRSQELAEIHGILQRPDVRLLTLTGPGGSGKTRLAIEAVRPLLSTIVHSIWFVDLAPVVQSVQLLKAIMRTVGIAETQQLTPRESLIA